MVCNPVPKKVTHIPDFFALATCPFCRDQQVVSHRDLKSKGRPIDGTAEWVCSLCKGIPQKGQFD